VKNTLDPEKDHHPFCNYFAQPRKGCKMCEKFWPKYPMERGMTTMDLVKKYFPDVYARNAPQ